MEYTVLANEPTYKSLFFFFNDKATTDIYTMTYTLSLHDTLPILLIFIIALIFCIISFIICRLIKSSYLAFFIFFILFGLSLIVPMLINQSSIFVIYSNYNIFSLIQNPHMWFMDMSPLMMKNYEVTTLVSNILLVLVGAIWMIKIFKRDEIN